MKKNTSERKKAVTLREAEQEVQKAEQLAQEVAQAAQKVMEDSKLVDLSTEEISEACEATKEAETKASKHLADTRKFITLKQIEAKGRDASSELSGELIKYEARLRAVATELGKGLSIWGDVEG